MQKIKIIYILLFLLTFSVFNPAFSMTYSDAKTNAMNNLSTDDNINTFYTSAIGSLSDSDNLTRTSGGKNQILTTTWTKASNYYNDKVGDTKNNSAFGGYDMWLSPAQQLPENLSSKGITSGSTIHYAIAKTLGINTDSTNNSIVEIWATNNNDVLQRATLNPAINSLPINVSGLTAGDINILAKSGVTPSNWDTFLATDSATLISALTPVVRSNMLAAGVIWTSTQASEYTTFLVSHIKTKAYISGGFPWTGLGYTYNWAASSNALNSSNWADSIRGLSEYVMLGSVGTGHDYQIGAIYSEQSYAYRVKKPIASDSSTWSNGDFKVTGALDSLWTGRRFQPNGGSITVTSTGNVKDGEGILVSSLGYTLDNAGSIKSDSTKKKFNIANSNNIVVLFQGEASDASSQTNTVINSGTIGSSSVGTAIKATGDTTITNTGTIEGSSHAILTSSGNDTVTSNSNSTIKGAVDLSDGTNSFTLDASTMTGNLTTGTGTDAVNLKNSSTMTGDISTGSGDDTIDINKSYFKGHINMGDNTNDQLKVTAGSTLDFATGEIKPVNLENLQLLPDSSGSSSNINLGLDINLANATGDLISAKQVTGGEKLNIFKLNQNGNIPTASSITIQAIDPANNLAAKTQLGVSSITTPILKYDVNYDNTTGNLLFSGGGGPTSKGYNPGVLASPIAAQIGGYSTQLNSYSTAFENMDMVMLMPRAQRLAFLFKNKFAAADSNLVFTPTMIPEEKQGGWIRPYCTFENVPLKNGPTVSNVMYGSLVGGDSPIRKLKHGFDGVFTGYMGYNGSHQVYDGISTYQNGGLLGATGVFYRGNFFTGLTANVGANAGEASTGSGRDNFTILTTGIASKTGYNCELNDGKFIIQPSYLMSYSFVDTFNYTNASGVRVNSEPLNVIQISPGLKLIGNLKNGWQPYLGVSMNWNIMDDTKFKANDVALPEMAVKPYVLYGAGVQKRWGERLTGFIQAMVSNGGRNGVGLQLNLRWSV